MKEFEDSGYGLVGLDGHGRRPHKTDPEDAPEIKWCWWLWQQTCRKDNLTPPRCLEWPHEFSQRCAWSLRGQTLNNWRELKLIFSIKGTFSPTGWKEPQPSFSLFFFIWVQMYSEKLMLTGTSYMTCTLRFPFLYMRQIHTERRQQERKC